mmetsp:Transcript_88027/g.251190  ORF Transcript_88027/g.251190 Transcript_88027/m.251190 type:complete len:209 (-) Transcript_88027:215-841(-)
MAGSSGLLRFAMFDTQGLRLPTTNVGSYLLMKVLHGLDGEEGRHDHDARGDPLLKEADWAQPHGDARLDEEKSDEDHERPCDLVLLPPHCCVRFGHRSSRPTKGQTRPPYGGEGGREHAVHAGAQCHHGHRQEYIKVDLLHLCVIRIVIVVDGLHLHRDSGEYGHDKPRHKCRTCANAVDPLLHVVDLLLSDRQQPLNRQIFEHVILC